MFLVGTLFSSRSGWSVHLLWQSETLTLLFHQPGDGSTALVLFSLPGLARVNGQRVSPLLAPGKARLQLDILAS